MSQDRFHVTTTTGGAAGVLQHMEDYLQTEFTSLRVHLTSITEQWACIALQGPRAAETLAPFLDRIDLTRMPHMSVREGRFAGVPTRLFRVSFTGELGFELNIPAGHGRAAWDLLRETGATRYGTETMHVLRAEKGFVVIGQETDGTVIPDDLGLSWAIARGKADFVGKRSLSREDMIRADRKQLVGLRTSSAAIVLEEGAQVTDGGARSVGHVTSAYSGVALALIAAGRARMGDVLQVPMQGRVIAVTVVSPVFHDSDGGRMTAPIPPVATATSGRALARALTELPRFDPCPAVELSLSPPTEKTLIRTVKPRDGALWLGPDEYLEFGAAAEGIDLSDAFIGLDLSGPRAADCLNAFCPLDFDALPVDTSTRTVFAGITIILWRRGANAFHLEIARSLAPHVWACLEEARREFRASETIC